MVKTLTLQQLKEVLFYDPGTGIFTRIKSHQPELVGKEAGYRDSQGYRRIKVNSKKYFTHRLVFFYMEGRWPIQQVDHINRDRSDNRWENLREVSNKENAQNSGAKGYSKEGNRWCSRISTEGKQIFLGSFTTREEAAAAYLAAKYIYHSTTMKGKYGQEL
jgi:hypothetical protein